MITGTVGSWALHGWSSVYVPWLPSGLDRVPLGGATSVTVGFADRTPISSWSARIADASDLQGRNARAVGSGDTAGAPTITVGTLPDGGRWVLEVHLVRSDERGNATFYWGLIEG